MAELKSFLEGREPVTFVDLFAGAGGISEGFLQADANNKYYDFLHNLKGLVYKTTFKPMADAICYSHGLTQHLSPTYNKNLAA